MENVLLRPTQFLYDYEGYRLKGFSAREIGEWDECVLAFKHVLTVQPGDEIVKNRLMLCEEKLKEMGKPSPQLKPKKEPAIIYKDVEVDEPEPEPIIKERIVYRKRVTGQGSGVAGEVYEVKGSFWDSLQYAFSFQFTLNVLGVLALLIGVAVFASKKCRWKKLKD